MQELLIKGDHFFYPEITGDGGGGKGGGGGGNEDPNTARSRAIANLTFALSEGEVAGFPAGVDIRKFIYLDETPIMAVDGTILIKGVTVDFRSGTQAQAPIAGADRGVANTSPVGVKITASGGAVTRLVADPNATAIRISMTTPGFRSVDGDGNIHGNTVNFKIQLSTNGGAFIDKLVTSFDFKTAGGYTRDYQIKVPANPTGNWQVRIVRTTPDSTSDKDVKDLYWQSIGTVTERKLRYPNTALLFIRLDAAHFRQIPKVTVKIKGLICRVPTNYDPIARTYTGMWNGVYKLAWTSNPAWILLEMLTNKRFGCGDQINIDQCDKGSFYKISQRNDEAVFNGLGGTEPRYAMHEYFRDSEDAWQFINRILSAMHCAAYYAGGQIVLMQDAPGTPVGDMFTNANVVIEKGEDGRLTTPPFRYERTSLQARHTVAIVKWKDLNEFGKVKSEYVDLAQIGYGTDMQRLGYRPIELNPAGCYSKVQAARYGRHALATEVLEKEIVYFGVGSQGALRSPGDIVQLQDNDKSTKRRGGRVVSATANTITLDAPVEITSASTSISVLIDEQQVTRTVNNPVGSHTVINVFPALAALPLPGAIWMITLPGQEKKYRVLTISEDREKGTYGIGAVAYKDTKYSLVDQAASIPVATITSRALPSPPTNFEILTRPDGFFVGWNPSASPAVAGYQLEKSEEGSNIWHLVPVRPGATDADILALTYSPARFRVAAIDIYGRQSDWVETGANYQRFGYVAERVTDGSVRLDRQVELLAGTTYYLRTSEQSAGQTVLVSRQITNTPGITDLIKVTPTFKSVGVTYTQGYYGRLGGQDSRIGFMIVTKVPGAVGSVTIADKPYGSGYGYSGASQELGVGTYRSEELAFGFLIRAMTVPAGFTVFAAENEIQLHPVPGSSWELKTTN
jgi:predicted phage tail protein